MQVLTSAEKSEAIAAFKSLHDTKRSMLDPERMQAFEAHGVARASYIAEVVRCLRDALHSGGLREILVAVANDALTKFEAPFIDDQGALVLVTEKLMPALRVALASTEVTRCRNANEVLDITHRHPAGEPFGRRVRIATVPRSSQRTGPRARGAGRPRGASHRSSARSGDGGPGEPPAGEPDLDQAPAHRPDGGAL